MGSSFAPTMADLTLSVLEYRYMTKTATVIQQNSLSKVYRYIDDILAINCGKSEFQEIAKSIYPNSLPLNHASGALDKCEFLDIQLLWKDNLITTVYDKTKAFNFPVVKFVMCSSNVPYKLGYSVYFSQLVRFARICSTAKEFRCWCKGLFRTMMANGYKPMDMVHWFTKFCCQNDRLLIKFGLFTRTDYILFGTRIFN